MKGSVDVYMASMYRSRHVLKTVETLWRNPEVGSITVVLNKYTDKQYDEVAPELKKMGCIVYRGDNSKGCSHKIQYIGGGQGEYVSLCDDDLLYPPDYFKVLIDKLNSLGGFVSARGRILKPGRVKNYRRERLKSFHALCDVEEDAEVDVAGTGVCLFKRGWFDDLHEWFGRVEHPNMTDIYVSYFVKQHGIKRYVIAHKKGWLLHKEKEEGDNYIWDTVRNNCEAQTDFVNNIWKPYQTYSTPS